MRRYTRGFALQPGAAIFNLPSFASKLSLSPVQWVTFALNKFLGRQQAAKNLLAAHAGRTFHINVGRLSLAFTIDHDGALQPADTKIVPDVELTVDVGLLARSGWTPGKALPELPGMVHVAGDAAMAQTLSILAKHWRPDLEDILADWMGDVAAVQVVQGARSLFSGVLVAANKLTENVAEFLAYESRSVTPVPVMRAMVNQLNEHQQKLNGVGQSVAALSARLEMLERNAAGVSRSGSGQRAM